jgi:pyruvate,orthophosphate dikinase
VILYLLTKNGKDKDIKDLLQKSDFGVIVDFIIMSSKMHKWVYSFGNGHAEGKEGMKDLLGGKGASLAEMSRIGLPVPLGFTITTEACTQYNQNNETLDQVIVDQVNSNLEQISKQLGLQFGDNKKPLLVSVRSGARASMPGMMDTILNVGLNDETVEGIAKMTSNPRFAYDSYRRLIQMYSNVVLNIDHHIFNNILTDLKRERNYETDSKITVEELKIIITKYKAAISEQNKEFPQDVNEQLWGAINAVFKSWRNERAIKYREIYNIPESWGTAVNVQSMVFGNLNDNSATGVCFTRNPSTGENSFYGEFLPNAQGEDVVAGIRTPHQITTAAKEYNFSEKPSLEEIMPSVFKQLHDVAQKLEYHFKNMQDIEFTVQDGKLWMLQCRNGKRTAKAAIKIAVDMVNEGIISIEQAVERIDANSLDQLLHPTIDPKATNKILTRGLPASPGAASGKVVFSPKDAEKKSKDNKVILVRNETSPEDITGMSVAQGVLTVHGGMTSHAAVVARGMGKPCITGASQVDIDFDKEEMTIGDQVIKAGDIITINGGNGDILLGAVPTIASSLSHDFEKIMLWADDIRKMKVRANADTPHDAKVAREFGAEGIGLCRTEHMFFGPERILAIREMILANDLPQRKSALAKLLPFQRNDFIGIFEAMKGLPVTIRLLDPPLHEFLPNTDEEIRVLANDLKVSVDWIKTRLEHLREANPMLGHRGCRLAMTYPEIYDMQSRAIFEAAAEVADGIHPEIMIPFVLDAKELEIIKAHVQKVAEEVMKEKNCTIKYSVGTMIELPRAALKAGEIAKHAEFFSFGTNDLTQTTMGISRDDSSKFLKCYRENEVFINDPFAILDQSGVGELVEMACSRGLEARPNLKLGICGEHGGDPESINFFQRSGLHYVSCSPFRVPIARLASAQAAIHNSKSYSKKKVVG